MQKLAKSWSQNWSKVGPKIGRKLVPKWSKVDRVARRPRIRTAPKKYKKIQLGRRNLNSHVFVWFFVQSGFLHSSSCFLRHFVPWAFSRTRRAPFRARLDFLVTSRACPGPRVVQNYNRADRHFYSRPPQFLLKMGSKKKNSPAAGLSINRLLGKAPRGFCGCGIDSKWRDLSIGEVSARFDNFWTTSCRASDGAFF